MNTWKIVCATLVIFIAGIVTGVVLVRIGERGSKMQQRFQRDNFSRPQTNLAGSHDQPTPNVPSQPNLPPNNLGNGPLSREFTVQLERQLHLSPQQREQVQKLLSEGQERIRELRQKVDPQVRQEMQRTHEQIQALLTPEQREQFQRLMKQRMQRRNESPMSPDRRSRETREPRPPQEREPLNPPPISEPGPEPRVP